MKREGLWFTEIFASPDRKSWHRQELIHILNTNICLINLAVFNTIIFQGSILYRAPILHDHIYGSSDDGQWSHDAKYAITNSVAYTRVSRQKCWDLLNIDVSYNDVTNNRITQRIYSYKLFRIVLHVAIRASRIWVL